MSRLVCFFDEKDGQTATCINENETCGQCRFNPFPGGAIPKDRVLRRKGVLRRKAEIPFEYELLSETEYIEMTEGNTGRRISRTHFKFATHRLARHKASRMRRR